MSALTEHVEQLVKYITLLCGTHCRPTCEECQAARLMTAMAKVCEAERNRKPTRGVYCSAECLGQCDGCKSLEAIAEARRELDALIPK